MTPEQSAAYIFSQSICAMIEVEGLKAENADREQRGFAQAYGEAAFLAVLDKYALDHNTVMGTFQGR